MKKYLFYTSLSSLFLLNNSLANPGGDSHVALEVIEEEKPPIIMKALQPPAQPQEQQVQTEQPQEKSPQPPQNIQPGEPKKETPKKFYSSGCFHINH